MFTERCLIENIDERDRAVLEKLFTNQDTRQYLGGIVKEENLEDKIDNLIENSINGSCLKVSLKGTDEFIGLLYLDLHHNGIDKELSYEFLPEYWGKGYAYESIKEFLQHVFNEKRLTRILAETQIKNKNSIKLLEKLGFVLIEEIERFGEKQGIFVLKKNIS